MDKKVIPLAMGVAILIGSLFLPNSATAVDSPQSNGVTGNGIVPFSSQLQREGLVLPLGQGFDSGEVGAPSVMFDEGVYKMWYHGRPAEQFWQTGYATSLDGRSWTRHGVVVSPTLPIEGSATTYPFVLKVDGTYWMWYSAWDGHYRILSAQSSDGINWTKNGVAIDLGLAGESDDYYVWEPSVVYETGIFKMWYGGRQASGPTSTFLAESEDGIHWTKRGVVLAPGAAGSPDDQGARDPAVVRTASQYVMLYTGLSGDGNWRLCEATSPDGVTWERQGVALDLGGPEESWALANANIVLASNGSWEVYYNGRGSVFQIFLATLPAEETGPLFEGARNAEDLGTGSNVRISWEGATEPGAGDLNVSLSFPIEYGVYVDLDPSGLGAGVPKEVTKSTSVVVHGLKAETTYYAYVRATDARGNADTNDRAVPFTLKTPVPRALQSSWVLSLLIGVVLLVPAALVVRRRTKGTGESRPRQR